MKLLHLLLNEPDDTVSALIASMSVQEGATVVSLYPDSISKVPVDWGRVVDDVMTHDRTICWW